MGSRLAGFADTGIVGAATGVLVMNTAKNPAAVSTFLAPRGWLVGALLIIVPVFSALKPFTWWAERGRDDARKPGKQRCWAALKGLIDLGLDRDENFDLSDPGVHLWKVRRTLKHPFRRRLHRVGSYRLGASSVTLRDFTPLRGTGVVGLCWKHGTERTFDVADLAARLPDKAAFDTHRTQNGSDAVMGLTWEQFDKIKHRGLVAAAPVRDGKRRFKGCVSVDLADGDDALLAELCRRAVALADSLGPDDLAPA